MVAILGLAGGAIRTFADDCCTLRGQVVSSADGAPVRGALVQLTGEEPQSAMTASDGTFAFPNLKAADFGVQVRKPGYFTPQQLYPASAPAVSIHLDANTAHLTLELIPEGVVAGRILDESGEPVEGMQVWLQPTKSEKAAGVFPRRDRMGVQSNEAGEYRIAGIRPGSYLLIASTNQTSPSSEFLVQTDSVRQSRRGFPTTYYPGTISRRQAVPVRVKAGSVQQLEIRVAKQPLYRIAGRVEAPGAAEGVIVILVSLANHSPFGVMRGSTDGAFVFPEVSPGEYLLWAAVDSNGSESEEDIRLGSRYLNVTGNLSGLAIPLAKAVSTEVHVRYELSHDTHAASPVLEEPLPIFFSRLDAQEDLLQMLRMKPPEDEGGVSHSFFEPGTYRLRTRPEAKMYVARATSGGTDLLREDLVVGPGSIPAPIEIVLRDDGAAVDGKVAGTAAMEEGRVLALPEDAPRRAVSTGVAANGSFHFANLPPGSYTIVALQNADALDLDDAQTLTRATHLGASLQLQANASSTVNLEWKHWDE